MIAPTRPTISSQPCEETTLRLETSVDPAEEVFTLRNIGIILGAVALAVLLASFAPISWSTTPHLTTVLASISPTDLTIGYGKLPMAEQADAF